MNRWLNRAANLLLMLLCSACLLRLVQDSFHLTVEPRAYLWLALLCVLLWAAVFFRYCFFPGIAAAVGVLWYLVRCREEDLSLELLDILLAVRSSWSGGFRNGDGAFDFQPMAGSHTLALLLILFIAVVYLTMVLYGESSRVSLSLLLTLPIAALCLAVNRNPPVLPLLGLGLFWTELFISGNTCRPDDASGRALLLTLLPCLAVLGVLLYFNSPSSYVPEDKALKLSQRIEQLSGSISSFLEKQSIPQVFQSLGRQSEALSGWDQGQDMLDLTRPYDFSSREHEVFTFRSSADGSLYLRGRSLGSYTGSGWTKAEEQPGSQALNYAAYAAAMASYTGSGTVLTCDFSIVGPRPYDTLYLPYFTISGASGDVSVPAGDLSAYGGQYLLLTGGSFGPLPDDLLWEELQYRSFVRDYYTRLPESTRDALAALAQQNGLDADDDSILAEVVDYVCRDSVYDLGVTPYPDGDYALYFLQSARRGYCIHYATAACCLYRALGIPARLCEGFLVSARAGSETIVRAADAHAWVEVWLDGVGWVPVEVTYGGSASEGGGADAYPRETEAARSDGITEQTPNPTPGGAGEGAMPDPYGGGSGTQEAGGSAETAPAPGNGEVKAGEDPRGAEAQPPTENKDESPGSAPEKRTNRILLTVSAVLAAVILAVVGRYVFVRNRLRRQLSEPDGRRRAVYLYREALRVLRFGGEMPEAVLTTAEKASFSPHSISEEELKRSSDALNALTEQVQHSLRPLRRLVFRYLLGL